ncbi:rab GTPase-activating protein 22-like isoform X5 [Solanum dulcamara]|uniref:rab GTPase-activating protein 22-like isoform X5 n=1 Tax=Solanum dulcamara TaxID=45834 RepID=UPI0024855368|nr:rab GTPase-activating protein 22-like isoform X5 [Solanum dulcamara]
MGNSNSSVAFKNGGSRAMKNSSSEELDTYYPVRPECLADVPKTRFKARVGKTLSERRWKAAFSKDGYLDIAGVLRRIQRGGIHPSIKGAAWEFLLGCFDPESTFEERNQLRQQRREQYAAWKSECQKIVPVIGSGKFITSAIVSNDGQPIASDDGQPIECATSTSNSQDNSDAMPADNGNFDKKMLQWKLSLHQIGLDVVRTDRTLVFYENEANQAKLWDVLAVYAWMDKDIGYVQGMSDICSPMIILLENEADAYWCFERAMRRLRENFKCSTDSIGVQSQLSTLAQIVKTVDPKLHQHLEELDGGEYLFAFRMLMVLFRREFSFVDSLYLWEILGEISGNLDARKALDEALKVHKKYLKQAKKS